MDFWGVLLLIVAFALMVYVMYALCIAIPMDMARDRHRDPVLWLIVSFLCSPFVAIFFLWILGDVSPKKPKT